MVIHDWNTLTPNNTGVKFHQNRPFKQSVKKTSCQYRLEPGND